MNLEHELEVACEIAREAGALVLGYHHRFHPPAEPTAPASADLVQFKAGDEPVTEADRAVNALCVARLQAHFPGDGLLTEELPDDGSRHGAARTWLVDPIDGTKDFIAGRPGFAVMIGLLVGGAPALGVVYQPLAGTLYFAQRGRGSYRREPGAAAPERLHVSQVAELHQARMVSSASHPSAVVDKVRQQAGILDEINIGSVGIKLSLIAAGERDLYINPLGRTKLWDTCAPQIILEEAGGRLTDARGEPLGYTGADLSHRRGLVASNGLLHDQALQRLRPLLTF